MSTIKSPLVPILLGLFVTGCSEAPATPTARTATRSDGLTSCKILSPDDETWKEGFGDECVGEGAAGDLDRQLDAIDWSEASFDDEPEATHAEWYAGTAPAVGMEDAQDQACAVEEVACAAETPDDGLLQARTAALSPFLTSQFISTPAPEPTPAAPTAPVKPVAPVLNPATPWTGTPQVNTPIPYGDFGRGTHIKIVTIEVLDAQGKVIATHQGWGVSGPNAANNVKPTFANGTPITEVVAAAGGHGEIRSAILQKVEIPRGASTVTRAGGVTVGVNGPEWLYRSDLNMRDMPGGDRALTPEQQKIFRSQVDESVRVPKNAGAQCVPVKAGAEATCKSPVLSRYQTGGRAALVGMMKGTAQQVLGVRNALAGPQGSFAMAQGNTTVVFAGAVMTAATIVDRYHKEHIMELAQKNDQAFREEFEAWIAKQAAAGGVPVPDDAWLRSLGRSLLVHFYDAETLTKALKEREAGVCKPGRTLAIDEMERDAAARYLELRFIEEAGWKPRWSYVQRTYDRWWNKFTLAFDNLVYTAPSGKKTVIVRFGGNLARPERSEKVMSWNAYVQWTKDEGYTVSENHTYDVPAPTVPNIGMRVFHLPKVPLVRSADVAAAIARAEELSQPASRVRAAYEASLGRTPSCQEVDGQLASGLSVDELRVAIAGSPEAEERIRAVFEATLFRSPKDAEMKVAKMLLGKGLSLKDLEARLMLLKEYGTIAMLRNYLGNDTKAIAGYLERIRKGESPDAIRQEIVGR